MSDTSLSQAASSITRGSLISGLVALTPLLRPCYNRLIMPDRRNINIPRIEIVGITALPEIENGAELGLMIVMAAIGQDTSLEDGDILVVTQKVISKAEGRIVDLRTVTPSERGLKLSIETERDPRLVELILRESKSLIKIDSERGIIIAETHHGFICANAGIDQSNVAGEHMVSLLPKDPDGSARRIREEVAQVLGVRVAVIISDTFGRAWREGQVNFAIGVSGIDPILDYRGSLDKQGSVLKTTSIAIADELVAAGEMVMGKAEGIPVALIRGYRYQPSAGGVAYLLRDPASDLFR